MKSAQVKKNEKSGNTGKDTAKNKPVKEEKAKTEKKNTKDEEEVKLKKPLSSYFLFMKEIRPKFQKENPDLKGKELNKVFIINLGLR